MASLTTIGIICAVRHHGEHGAIVRVLTPDDGMVAGYVRGGRSRRLRPVLMAGNQVMIEARARTEDQLAGITVELMISRASCLEQVLTAAALDWLTSLTAASLAEGQPYPAIFRALNATLDAVSIAASARQWAAAVARYENLLLAELGFGLNLEYCAVTQKSDQLLYLSPKSGCAISEKAAIGYESRLFRLPSFLRGQDKDPAFRDVLDGLLITGHFLDRDILDGQRRDLMPVRARLTERLKRAVA